MLTALQRTIISDNRRLTTFVLKRHFLPHRVYAGRWDVLKAASVSGLVDAALRCNEPQLIAGKWHAVNPHTGKLIRFSTYACTTIWGVCMRALRKHAKEPVAASIVAPSFSDYEDYSTVKHPESRRLSPVETAIRSDDARAVRESLRWLTPLDRACIVHKFGLEDGIARTNEEVAQLLGVGKVRVGQRVARAYKALATGGAGKILRQCLEGV